MGVPTPQERKETLNALALKHCLSSQLYTASDFKLLTVKKSDLSCHGKNLSIYIEGDGLGWITDTQISQDPTPVNPLAFKLFLLDANACSIYAARPCQYVRGANCTSAYWTNKRFSEEVIQSYDTLLDRLKSETGSFGFTIIGYSGGGAVAALLAARRSDVKELITVAGNLDTDEWVKYHHISPLEGSLNPADYSKKLSKVPQMHFIADADTIVPKAIFDSYKKRFEQDGMIKYKVYKGVKHDSGWEERWKIFLKETDHYERTKQ